MASELLQVEDIEDLGQESTEHREAKITFCPGDDAKNKEVSGGFFKAIQGSQFPFLRQRFKQRRNHVGLIVLSLAGIVIIITAISVPMAFRGKTDHNKVSTLQARNGTRKNEMTLPPTESIQTTPFITAGKEMTTLPDEAADLVAKGWFPVHYSDHIYLYKISADPATYTNAKNGCKRDRAILAAIGMRKKAIRNELFSEMVFPTGQRIYIGLDDLSSKHTWQWIDGVVSTHQNTNWMPNEPNDSRERCAEIEKARGFTVNDFRCDQVLHYLCEKVY